MSLFKELSVVLAVQSSWDEASSGLPCTAKLSVAGWSIAERAGMHNADNLLEFGRCSASTIVTAAERISVPRKTAADNA
jgi:hypothetical protein